jgi:hypothetical protein
MKIKSITIEMDDADEDDNFEFRALTGATKNQSAIDDLYQTIFRPVIKYDDNTLKVEIYEELWDRIKEHFE